MAISQPKKSEDASKPEDNVEIEEALDDINGGTMGDTGTPGPGTGPYLS
jgi:hypothetical protein